MLPFSGCLVCVCMFCLFTTHGNKAIKRAVGVEVGGWAKFEKEGEGNIRGSFS